MSSLVRSTMFGNQRLSHFEKAWALQLYECQEKRDRAVAHVSERGSVRRTGETALVQHFEESAAGFPRG